MSRFQINSTKVKFVGIVSLASLAIAGLIRCTPGDPAVTSASTIDPAISAKVKEVEAAAESHASKAAEAEKAAAKTGHSKSHNRAPASASAKNSLFVVQIGAFKVKENAEKLTKKLKDAGYPVRLQSMNHSKNGELHLVRFEPTPNRNEAQDAVEQLKAKESLTAQVLALPSGT